MTLSSNADGQKPLVSLLIVAHRCEPYIDETLQSLTEQTYPHWEALVVDGGSPDNVADKVLRWQAIDSRIHFFHTPDYGVNAARNHAARNSHGEYLMVLDGDDRLAPEYLKTCISAFDNPTVKASLCQWQFFGSNIPQSYLRYTGYEDLLMMNSIHVTTMVRRDDYFRIGGFDENRSLLLDDWDFWIRLLDGEPDGALAMNPAPLFLYRRRPGSRLSKMDNPAIRSDFQKYMYRKHGQRYHRHFGNVVTPQMIGYVPAKNIRLLMEPTGKNNETSLTESILYACKGCALSLFPAESQDAYLDAAADKLRPMIDKALPHMSHADRNIAMLLMTDRKRFIAKVRRREALRGPVRALWHRICVCLSH